VVLLLELAIMSPTSFVTLPGRIRLLLGHGPRLPR
jgi:hypothetical protein